MTPSSHPADTPCGGGRRYGEPATSQRDDVRHSAGLPTNVSRFGHCGHVRAVGGGLLLPLSLFSQLGLMLQLREEPSSPRVVKYNGLYGVACVVLLGVTAPITTLSKVDEAIGCCMDCPYQAMRLSEAGQLAADAAQAVLAEALPQ